MTRRDWGVRIGGVGDEEGKEVVRAGRNGRRRQGGGEKLEPVQEGGESTVARTGEQATSGTSDSKPVQEDGESNAPRTGVASATPDGSRLRVHRTPQSPIRNPRSWLTIRKPRPLLLFHPTYCSSRRPTTPSTKSAMSAGAARRSSRATCACNAALRAPNNTSTTGPCRRRPFQQALADIRQHQPEFDQMVIEKHGLPDEAISNSIPACASPNLQSLTPNPSEPPAPPRSTPEDDPDEPIILPHPSLFIDPSGSKRHTRDPPD